jgi:hypothetical protein
LQPVAAEAGVRFTVQIADGVHTVGHPHSLRERIFNLLNYALRCCASGRAVSVRLVAQAAEAVLIIETSAGQNNSAVLRPIALEQELGDPALSSDWMLAVARCTLANMGAALESRVGDHATRLEARFQTLQTPAEN